MTPPAIAATATNGDSDLDIRPSCVIRELLARVPLKELLVLFARLALLSVLNEVVIVVLGIPVVGSEELFGIMLVVKLVSIEVLLSPAESVRLSHRPMG